MKNKDFLVAAARRALRTLCQTFVSTIGSAVIIEEVKWQYVLSASILSAIVSIAMSIATGLPEVEPQESEE